MMIEGVVFRLSAAASGGKILASVRVDGLSAEAGANQDEGAAISAMC